LDFVRPHHAPPGYYVVTVTTLLDPTVPEVVANLGVGGTPGSGILPFLMNYAPQQLAQAIGAPRHRRH
jgi:hypothetical protein